MTRRFIRLTAACLLAAFSWQFSAFSAPQTFSGWRTDTRKRSIELSEILSGGVGKDAIPALNEPRFVEAKEASHWLEKQEPVIALRIGAEARAYPLQILIWHEIVNDVIGETPIAVTFCPLCYSAIAFDRRSGGQTLTLGVTGMLRNSDMLMYDRETESWWQQVLGEAIVGELTGTKLTQLPAQIISFEQFTATFPDGRVLSRETGHKREYGRNPYVGYDDIANRPFLFRGKLDGRLTPMEKLVTVSVTQGEGQIDKAYPHSITRKQRVIHDRLGTQPLVIFHADGALSALDQAEISTSRQAGSVGVFDPRVGERQLTFKFAGSKFVDEETRSEWNITGQAISGELKGAELRALPHGHEFAFAWLVFKPQTLIYRGK